MQVAGAHCGYHGAALTPRYTAQRLMTPELPSFTKRSEAVRNKRMFSGIGNDPLLISMLSQYKKPSSENESRCVVAQSEIDTHL